jgi:hypothetical protein
LSIINPKSFWGDNIRHHFQFCPARKPARRTPRPHARASTTRRAHTPRRAAPPRVRPADLHHIHNTLPFAARLTGVRRARVAASPPARMDSAPTPSSSASASSSLTTTNAATAVSARKRDDAGEMVREGCEAGASHMISPQHVQQGGRQRGERRASDGRLSKSVGKK